LHKPIYYLSSEYNSFEQNHFFKLHKGGMLAWYALHACARHSPC
jgi:hypothetical protein